MLADCVAALELPDGDSPNRAPERIDGSNAQIQRLRWKRCEIDNYLLHPGLLRPLLGNELGAGRPEIQAGLDELTRTLGVGFDPMAEQPPALLAAYLESKPASKGLLQAVMQAAGLNQFPQNFVVADSQWERIAATVFGHPSSRRGSREEQRAGRRDSV